MSSEITFDGGGFEDFEELLKQYSENVSSDKALDAVEEGAKEFVNDLLSRPGTGSPYGFSSQPDSGAR